MSEQTKAELMHYYRYEQSRIQSLSTADDSFWEWVADDSTGRKIQLRELYAKDPKFFDLAQDDLFWEKVSDENVLFLLSLLKEIID